MARQSGLDLLRLPHSACKMSLLQIMVHANNGLGRVSRDLFCNVTKNYKTLVFGFERGHSDVPTFNHH